MVCAHIVAALRPGRRLEPFAIGIKIPQNVVGGFCGNGGNELILDFPTKSKPSGCGCGAANASMTRLALYLRDCMKERAADMASPAAGAADRLALGVGKLKKSFVGAGRHQRRVVEFVPANDAAGSP